VRDVAEGHILACERGRPGERYILGAENMTLQQIFENLAELTGRKAPTVRIPYAVAYAARTLGCGQDGSQEDVGEARQGGTGAGIQSRAGP
jgi:nucleoside-diphosphate-sugar epimerase